MEPHCGQLRLHWPKSGRNGPTLAPFVISCYICKTYVLSHAVADCKCSCARLNSVYAPPNTLVINVGNERIQSRFACIPHDTYHVVDCCHWIISGTSLFPLCWCQSTCIREGNEANSFVTLIRFCSIPANLQQVCFITGSKLTKLTNHQKTICSPELCHRRRKRKRLTIRPIHAYRDEYASNDMHNLRPFGMSIIRNKIGILSFRLKGSGKYRRGQIHDKCQPILLNIFAYFTNADLPENCNQFRM